MGVMGWWKGRDRGGRICLCIFAVEVSGREGWCPCGFADTAGLTDLAGNEDGGMGWIELLFCIADPVGGGGTIGIYRWRFLSVSTRVLGVILGCIGS